MSYDLQEKLLQRKYKKMCNTFISYSLRLQMDKSFQYLVTLLD